MKQKRKLLMKIIIFNGRFYKGRQERGGKEEIKEDV